MADAEKKESKITAEQVVDLLRVKHSEDVFVTECKNGPTQSVSHYCKLDAWAMNRSWTNACTFGYEVKVSRQDFLRDDKWMQYLQLCNAFYFVCPPNLIQVSELPAEVGLLYTSTAGKMLLTKKKAPQRQVQLPESLWRYILMCRAFIKDETRDDSQIERCRRWLAQKEEEREIGYHIGQSLRHIVDKQVDEVKQENKRLKEQNDALEDVRKMLEAMGVKPTAYWLRQEVSRQVEALTGVLPPGFIEAVKNLERDCAVLSENYRRVTAEGKNHESASGRHL